VGKKENNYVIHSRQTNSAIHFACEIYVC